MGQVTSQSRMRILVFVSFVVGLFLSLSISRWLEPLVAARKEDSILSWKYHHRHFLFCSIESHPDNRQHWTNPPPVESHIVP